MKLYRRIILAAAIILVSPVLAHLMTPHELMARSPDQFDLEQIVPKRFAAWTLVPNVRLIVPPDDSSREIYNQEFGRGYADRDGHIVMLLVAYGAGQSYRLRMHRPEVCYVAGGFHITPVSSVSLSYRAGALPIAVERLVAQRGQRSETISYWMRVGDTITTGIWDSEFARFKAGLRGLIPDGMLIRVSTVGLNDSEAYAVQDRFIQDLLASVGSKNLEYFVGSRS